jgi:hypothetical protein
MGPGEDTAKPTKAERLHHNIITTVRTKKRTYNVTISLTGFRISHVAKTKGHKHTTYIETTWDDIDKSFDK